MINKTKKEVLVKTFSPKEAKKIIDGAAKRELTSDQAERVEEFMEVFGYEPINGLKIKK